jgi:hypothetical protein
VGQGPRGGVSELRPKRAAVSSHAETLRARRGAGCSSACRCADRCVCTLVPSVPRLTAALRARSEEGSDAKKKLVAISCDLHPSFSTPHTPDPSPQGTPRQKNLLHPPGGFLHLQ